MPTRRTLLAALPFLLAATPGERVRARRRTPWGTLEVVERPDGRRLLREDGQSHSLYDPAHPTALAYDYLQLLTCALALHEGPGRVAIVGLGGGSLSRWLAHHRPELALTAVELSRDVVRLARRFFDLPDGLEVHVADGRAFLEQADRFDVVVLDASSEAYVPPHLATVEFFRSIDAPLVLMNSWRGAPRADDELATWCAAFPRPWVLTHGAPTEDNRVLVAAPAGREVPDRILAEAARRAVPIDVRPGVATGTVQHDPA